MSHCIDGMFMSHCLDTSDVDDIFRVNRELKQKIQGLEIRAVTIDASSLFLCVIHVVCTWLKSSSLASESRQAG